MMPRERLTELSQLPDGWNDGAGKALDSEGCMWLANMLEKHELDWWFCPWRDSDETILCAEFLVGKRYFMPEITLSDRFCRWLDFDDDDVTGEEFEIGLDLNDEASWIWMKERIDSYV